MKQLPIVCWGLLVLIRGAQVAQCADSCSQCMTQLKTYAVRARCGRDVLAYLLFLTPRSSIASGNFSKACSGKDPRNLQAPSAHELAWSHALNLARDAEAETLLCRCVCSNAPFVLGRDSPFIVAYND